MNGNIVTLPQPRCGEGRYFKYSEKDRNKPVKFHKSRKRGRNSANSVMARCNISRRSFLYETHHIFYYGDALITFEENKLHLNRRSYAKLHIQFGSYRHDHFPVCWQWQSGQRFLWDLILVLLYINDELVFDNIPERTNSVQANHTIDYFQCVKTT